MTRLIALGVGLWAAAAAATQAATVHVSVSPDEILLGEGLIVEVSVINAEEHEPPYWPKLEDFTITGQSSPSIHTSWINGVSSKKHIYRYQLTAKREGRLTIPSLVVSADGVDHKTKPVEILVTESRTGKPFFVELLTNKTDVYVQEPLELTLNIWIRPFQQGRLVLKQADMLQMIRKNSQWGVFAQAVETTKVTASSRKHADQDGTEHTYYVYQWKQTVWPERAGPLELEPVTIPMDYPVLLEQDFFRGLIVSKSRAFIETPELPKITVKPIPEADRPKIYPKGGAVGTFAMKVTAKPTEVRVGDPITLQIRITGTGRLEYVAAPPLNEVPELVENFKVHEEPLPGQIENGAKVFTQSIRAKSAAVSEIPPIPFAFFDPKTEQFRTIHSNPIPLKVEAASEVNATDVVAAATDRKTRLLTEAGGGLLANYSDPSELLATQTLEGGWGWLILMGLCPVAYAVTFLTTRQRRRLREDVGLARRRSAKRHAREKLSRARTSADPGERASLVATAVLTYIADCLNLPVGGMTRPDALDRLRRHHVDPNVLERTDALLAACEAARFAGRREAPADALLGPAHQCVKELEKIRLGAPR